MRAVSKFRIRITYTLSDRFDFLRRLDVVNGQRIDCRSRRLIFILLLLIFPIFFTMLGTLRDFERAGIHIRCRIFASQCCGRVCSSPPWRFAPRSFGRLFRLLLSLASSLPLRTFCPRFLPGCILPFGSSALNNRGQAASCVCYPPFPSAAAFPTHRLFKFYSAVQLYTEAEGLSLPNEFVRLKT